jgi:hypothetical protein
MFWPFTIISQFFSCRVTYWALVELLSFIHSCIHIMYIQIWEFINIIM